MGLDVTSEFKHLKNELAKTPVEMIFSGLIFKYSIERKYKQAGTEMPQRFKG